MNCLECGSHHIRKNGIKRGKQNHICCNCHRQFIQDYEPSKTYSNEIKEECIRMYLNGMGFRGIERVKGVHHTTIITWVKQLGQNLPDAPPIEEIPEVGEQGCIRNFCWLKKNKIWLWTAVNHFREGILAWVLGDHSAETFKPLWDIVCCWNCYFYVTDGWKVYPQFIDSGDQIVSKIYMTRVEGENTRLRHYLARLHRKTLCYSRVRRNAEILYSIITSLLEVSFYPGVQLIHTALSNAHSLSFEIYC